MYVSFLGTSSPEAFVGLLWSCRPTGSAAVMPRRGSTAIDEVDSLLRGGKQRAQIFTSDVTVAKNYLNEQNLRELNRIVTGIQTRSVNSKLLFGLSQSIESKVYLFL